MAGILRGIYAALGVIAATVSMSSVSAAPTGAPEFNHATTGFPLTGGHATAVCETCHVGGVFKGTPRDCDGCHALGKRVVATPKSASHVVTDAPCDSCHFNTATFFGARYNHSLSRQESCTTCHNGRIAQGRPGNHNSGKKAADSCDHCHRTSAFLPSSWNHTGVLPGQCNTCHEDAGQVSAENLKPSNHTTIAKSTYACDECHNFVSWIPAKYKHRSPAACGTCHNDSVAVGKPATHTPGSLKGMNDCGDCHVTSGWSPARFNHNTGGTCSSCHNGVLAMGSPSSHSSFSGWPTECSACHTSTVTWAGALGAMPANHIPFNSGVTCSACHSGNSVATGATLHAYVSSTCKNCHNSSPVYLGSMRRVTLGRHEGSTTGQDCTSCHARQYNKWNEP